MGDYVTKRKSKVLLAREMGDDPGSSGRAQVITGSLSVEEEVEREPEQ